MENRIWYKDIKRLGFEEQVQEDNVYKDKYGYGYVIIKKQLTKTIYLDWERETGKCYLVRLKRGGRGDIANRIEIMDVESLESMMDFYTMDED